MKPPLGIVLCVSLITTAVGSSVRGKKRLIFVLFGDICLSNLFFAGVVNCLNHGDCIGANRECHRNTTMKIGVCVCKPGYKAAVGGLVKCLNLADHECASEQDCPSGFSCTMTFKNIPPWDGSLNDIPFKFNKRQCTFSQYLSRNLMEPHTGGGLRLGGDFFNDHHHRFTRYNRIHHTGLNPEYIKFVEDCMLVLFLLCVLVTLMVVHRASCYRYSPTQSKG